MCRVTIDSCVMVRPSNQNSEFNQIGVFLAFFKFGTCRGMEEQDNSQVEVAQAVEWVWVGGYSTLSTLVLIFNLLILFSVAKNKYLHYTTHYVMVALALRSANIQKHFPHVSCFQEFAAGWPHPVAGVPGQASPDTLAPQVSNLKPEYCSSFKPGL